MILEYEVEFLDFWHISSGLSGGARLDSMVIKDSSTNLPYMPGKTFKGLVREMAKVYDDKDFLSECFGDEETKMGRCYFSNAYIDKKTQQEIIENNLQEYLYEEIASTKIEENGIATDNSLREIEVVVPLKLKGKIEDIPSKYKDRLIESVKMVKRVGLNRNRGLGRCTITTKELS